jgi:quercetin dioxygenase-like cupin family protein
MYIRYPQILMIGERQMSADERLREHPRDRLAIPVQHIAIQEATAQLRAESHAAVAGHRQVTLVKRGAFTLILFVFEPDGMLKEHSTEGEVSIHVLAGRLEVMAGSEAYQVGPGELISLAPGQSHSVRAMAASEMLLTICREP